MKAFIEVAPDPIASRAQIGELGQLLRDQGKLEERKHILPFFRSRPHLAAALGSINPALITPDRIAFEYDLFGDFKCDRVVGDSRRKAYSFIEFEEGGPGSVFVAKARKASPEWSPRFDHGFSQIIDWFWKLRDLERTHEFQARFGEPIEYSAMLVIGRGMSFGPREDRRWRWRQQSVIVDSKHVNCLTFEQLYEALALRSATAT